MTDEQILEAVGFGDDTNEVRRAEVVTSIRTTVELRLIGIIGELIGDERQDEFDAVQKAGDPQAVWEWLRSNVTDGVDVSELYAAALQDYIDEYLANQFTPGQ